MTNTFAQPPCPWPRLEGVATADGRCADVCRYALPRWPWCAIHAANIARARKRPWQREEIAQMFGVCVSSIDHTCERAIRKLRKRLGGRRRGWENR